MKVYPVIDLTGDSYINPAWPGHNRAVNSITSISIHHSAVVRSHEYDTVASIKRETAEHYNRLGPGLAYNYVIDNIGEIFKTRPHNLWTFVVGSNENPNTLSICLDGYFHPPHNQKPTREQYEALAQLLTKLCDASPEFPATWPNVRPHRDYSATACPGDTFAPFITAINSKADAYNIPVNAIYDHPELQLASTLTPLGQPLAPPPATINYRVFDLAGKQQGAYGVRANAWNKYVSLGKQAKIIDSKGVDITASFVIEFEPPPPPSPPTPPVVSPNADHEKRLSVLEALVKTIVDFLSSIFINFKK